MGVTRRILEEQMVRVSHRMHQAGWVANHDGNVTARLPEGRFLATPTAVSKGDVQRSWLIVVDENGKRVGGLRKPFSELELHLYIYRRRPDVGVVLHSHAPCATALAVAGIAVCPRMLAEPVVSPRET
ncbi:MAG: class II aldolase/adducin family protein [Myxococcota bacterium]